MTLALGWRIDLTDRESVQLTKPIWDVSSELKFPEIMCGKTFWTLFVSVVFSIELAGSQRHLTRMSPASASVGGYDKAL